MLFHILGNMERAQHMMGIGKDAMNGIYNRKLPIRYKYVWDIMGLKQHS